MTDVRIVESESSKLGARKSNANSRSTPDLVRSSVVAPIDDVTTRGSAQEAPRRIAMEDSSTLTASQSEKRLRARLAYLSGGMDDCHPLVMFPCETLIAASAASDDDLGSVLKYYLHITCFDPPSHPGFTLVFNGLRVTWAVVRTLLGRLEGLFVSWIHRVLVVKSTSFLDKIKSLVGKPEFSFEVIDLPSLRDLCRIISPAELTPEFGGTLPYDHQEWVKNRLNIENFVSSCRDVSVLLTVITDVIVPVRKIHSIQEARDRRSKAREDSETAKSVVVKTTRQGDVLLRSLEHTEDASPPLATWTPDYVNGTWCVQEEKRGLDEEATRVVDRLNDYVRQLDDCVAFYTFKGQAGKVLEELHARKEVVTKLTVGETLAQSRNKLEGHFGFENDLEILEQKCQTALSAAKEFDSSHYASNEVTNMRQSIERALSQLKQYSNDRGTLLEKSVEFYTILEKVEEWCSEGMDILARLQMDSALTLDGISIAIEELDAFLTSRVDASNLQKLGVQMSNFVAQERAEKALQRRGELHALIENRKGGLNRIARTLAARKPTEISIPKNFSSETTSNNQSEIGGDDDVDDEAFDDEADGLMTQVMLIKEEEPTSLIGPETNENVLKRREFVMAELLETERTYIEDLRQIIEGYWKEMDPQSPFLPPVLKGKRHIVFGNLKHIYDFHQNVFIHLLEQRADEPPLVGQCFLEKEKEFQMYAEYCKNKVNADEFFQDCDQAFFRTCQKNIGHTLPLSSYLLKPVQRITKYQLLLKDMMNCSKKDEEAYGNLQEALSKMLLVLKHVNDSMHSIGIEGYRGSLIEQGNLLLQDSFRVWENDAVFKKERVRHVFLYEKLIIFSKKRKRQKASNKTVYSFKSSLKVNDIGLTETVEDQPRRFIVSEFGGNQRSFTLHARSTVVKQSWVEQIRRLLEEQLAEIKDLVAERTGYVVIGGPKPGLSILPQDFSERRVAPSRSPSIRRGQRPEIYRETVPDARASIGELSPLKRGGADSTRSASFRMSRGNRYDGGGGVRSPEEKKPPRSASVEELSTGYLLKVNDGDSDHYDAEKTHNSTSDLISIESESDEWDDDDDEDAVLDVNLAPDQPRHYVAIADFSYDNPASDESVIYLSLKVGDRVEVIQLGQGGWWFVRWYGQARPMNEETEKEGWVPASYLEVMKGVEERDGRSSRVNVYRAQENAPFTVKVKETSV